MKTKYFILLIMLVMKANLSFSQATDTTETQLMVYPSLANGTIKLRWATNNAQKWSDANTKGYYIKRQKIDANGTVLATVWLNGGNAIMPLAKGASKETSPWNPYFEFTVVNNDSVYAYPNHITMFGAIYGEVGQLEDKITKIQATKVNDTTYTQSQRDTLSYKTTDEPMQRHFTAMIASEVSFEAAKLGGLGYEDNSAIYGETYQYVLYASTVQNTAPTVVQSVICNTLIVNTLIPASQNRTDNCKEIILDEGFESDPASTFEYNAEPIESSGSTTSLTPPSGVGTNVLAFTKSVSLSAPPVLPNILIEGKFGKDQINVLKWSLTKKTALRKFDVFRRESTTGAWKKINKSPVFSLMDNEGTSPNNIHYYTDNNTISNFPVKIDTVREAITLSKNVFQTYYYKIIGSNIFDEVSSYSNEVSGRALDSMVVYPHIDKYTLVEGTQTYQVKMNINYYTGMDILPNEIIQPTVIGNSIIQKVELEKSTNGDINTFQKVVDIPFNSWSSYIFSIPTSQTEAVYYRLKTTFNDINRKATESSPIMIQLSDEIPPSIPTDISVATGYPKIEGGKVKIKLKWTKNIEPDFLGYRIFKKNFAAETAMNVTKIFTKNDNDNTLFFPASSNNEIILDDELSTTSLNTKVIYQIMTVDKRFNQSLLSATIEVARPNLVPPVLPVFSNQIVPNDPKNKTIFAVIGGVPQATIKWSVSIDDDIEKYELFRFNSKNFNLVGATPIATFLPPTFMSKTEDDLFLQHIDNTIQLGSTYIYVLRLKDKYLTSEEFISEKPLIVEVPTLMENVALPTLLTFTQTNRKDPNWIELNWTITNPTEVIEYEIYRGEFKGDFIPANTNDKIKTSSWKVLSSDYTSIKDKNLTIGNSYRYMIRAKFKNGSFTAWKNIEEVNY